MYRVFVHVANYACMTKRMGWMGMRWMRYYLNEMDEMGWGMRHPCVARYLKWNAMVTRKEWRVSVCPSVRVGRARLRVMFK